MSATAFNLGGGKAKSVLLWSNSNPSSRQDAFTANLSQSLTNFDSIVIVTKPWFNDSAWNTAGWRTAGYFGPVPSPNVQTMFITADQRWRYMTVTSNTSIYFTTGYDGAGQENRGCIVTAIYGIKGFDASPLGLGNP